MCWFGCLEYTDRVQYLPSCKINVIEAVAQRLCDGFRPFVWPLLFVRFAANYHSFKVAQSFGTSASRSPRKWRSDPIADFLICDTRPVVTSNTSAIS